MSFPPPITGLKLSVSTGTAPNVQTFEQTIPSASLGNNSMQIMPNTDVFNAFTNNPAGTIFNPSIVTSYGSDELGNAVSAVSTPSVVANFIARKTTPTLSLSSIPNKLTTDSQFSLSVTTNSTGVLSYSSSAPSVATVNSSGLVTIVGAGPTTISVSVAASSDGLYAAAGPVSTQLVVKAIPNLSIAAFTNKSTTDSPFSLSVTTNSTGVLSYQSSLVGVATVNSSGLVTIVGAGTTTITVNLAASSDGLYAAASVTQPLVVALPPITLAANGVTIQYTGSAQAVIDAYNSATPKPLFIQENPRGTLLSGVPQPEWFAVVNNSSKAQITSYAKSAGSAVSAYFTPPEQSGPVPFNNIVTTLMTDMSDMFIFASEFNKPIGSWDTANVTDMTQMFFLALAFNQNIGSWNTAKVENMTSMFVNAQVFSQNIGSWNTAKVTTMQSMFTGAQAFNQNIGSWNTALVTSMFNMFNYASAFNQNIGSWNTAKVTNMNGMFQNATVFNRNISGWNVSSVTQKPPTNFSSGSALTGQNTPVWFPITRAANNVTIQYTPTSIATEPRFIRADPRNPGSLEWFAVVTNASKSQITSYANNEAAGISYFTPSEQSDPVPFNNIVTTLMTDMNQLFFYATAFNKDISSWDTSKVTNMTNMFFNTLKFNQNIDSWNTALVTNMNGMFRDAKAFNQNIGSWNTALVTDMETMFAGASVFNNGGSPTINSWNTAKVTSMNSMFFGALAFNQPIGSWDTAKVTGMNAMFYGATVFNQDLSGWNVALTPARPGLQRDIFATWSPLALPENSHKLPLFQ